MSRVSILGIPIDALTRLQAVGLLLSFLENPKQHHVMTPNAEMLVESTKNPAFREVLLQSDLNLPDSQGLVWAASLMGEHLPQRVTGVDTMIDLCSTLTDHSVFLLGAAEGVALRAADILQKKNPHLHIVGTFSGTPKDENAADVIRRINAASPQLLLVAYGAPAQDLWIDKHLAEMPSVRVAMGVGGTFDFIAGTRKRAPNIFQVTGLEWLWRLILEPSRFPRIFNAVVVFPVLVLHFGSKGPRAAAQ